MSHDFAKEMVKYQDMSDPCIQCTDDEPELLKQALCIIGDKWTALILRWLHEEPMRFSDFREKIPEINPRTLTQRLAKLEENGIVEKKHFTDPQSCTKYAITEKGIGLDEVLHAMATWSKKYS